MYSHLQRGIIASRMEYTVIDTQKTAQTCSAKQLAARRPGAKLRQIVNTCAGAVLYAPLSHTRIRSQAPERAAEFSSPRVRGRFFQQFGKNRKTLRKREEKTARILPEPRQLHAQAHPGAHRGASARVSLQTPPRVKKFSTPCTAP